MFDKERFKSSCAERETVDIYSDWIVDKILKELLNIVYKDKESFYEFIEYMKTEMIEAEYSTMSEISDEIVYERSSLAFIEAYKMLAEKYPEETKKYHIANFIKDAEKSVKCSLQEGRTMY